MTTKTELNEALNTEGLILSGVEKLVHTVKAETIASVKRMRKCIGCYPQTTCYEWKLEEWNKSNESIGGHDVITPLYTHPPESSNTELLEALQLSLSAMEHMGNILNDLDAVDAEDVAITAPAFDAARAAIAKAQGESK